ncbi:MAG TPA: hypothetical protein VE974_05535 [Thermoanaerobaculia bacterium]|nr:hypothetical protein [Thermoanaerobaculia bacterium]
MTDHARTILLKDRHLPWEGAFPYDLLSGRLAALGARPIGPGSTSDEIKEAFFDVMAGGSPSHEVRAAWDALRLADQRLLIDFFLYELSATSVESAIAELAALESPVSPACFRELANIPPDLEVLTAPERIDTGADPPEPPVNIGPVSFNVLSYLEEA